MTNVKKILEYGRSQPALSFALAGWLLTIIVFFTQAWPEFKWQGLDFACYYSIGEAILSGKTMTMYNTGEQGPWISYAPFATTSFFYFALVPFKKAKIAFFALKILAYSSWPFLLAAGTGKNKFSVRALIAAVVACIVMSPSVYEETVVGNINVFLLTALFAAVVLAQRMKVFSAATIITVIAICKPQYALFWIPVFLLRPSRAIMGGLTGVALATGHALIFLSPPELVALTQKWASLISTPIAGPNDANNMSTLAVIERLLTPMNLIMSGSLQGINFVALGSAMATQIAKVTSAVLSLIAAATILPVLKSIRHDDDSFVVWFAAMTFMTLYIAPVVWLTHFMLMVYPVFTLLFKLSKSRVQWAALVSAGVAGAVYSAGQLLNGREALRIEARAFGWPYWLLTLVLGGLVIVQIKQLFERETA